MAGLDQVRHQLAQFRLDQLEEADRLEEQMMALVYQSGEEVKSGDRIIYHGDPGEVEFVIVSLTGDPAMDWYLEKFPGGGFMINAKGFGSVFLGESDIDEDLEFLSRRGDH